MVRKLVRGQTYYLKQALTNGCIAALVMIWEIARGQKQALTNGCTAAFVMLWEIARGEAYYLRQALTN